MTKQLESAPIQERFQHLLKLMSSGRFLGKEGLGNEVPFFICPFKPEESAEMSGVGKQLQNKLKQAGIPVLKINLYDLAIEILKGRDNIFDRVVEMEPSVSKEEILELFQNVLDAGKHIIPAIAEKMAQDEFKIMFITGVGEVFPYIRSHNILNNLQSTAKDKPTVMFFPGKYSHSLEKGASLDLFGRLHDDRYYRAFNIFHCEV